MRREEPAIYDYIAVLKKRRWTVAAVFLAVFLTVAAATLMATPLYRATAQVYIDPGASAQYAFQQAVFPFDNTSYIQTQIGILRSEAIARKVVERMGLDEREGGSSFSLSGILGFFRSGPDDGPSEDNRDAAVKEFIDRLGVEAVKNSNLVKVSYEAEDPALAADVVNATVQTFIEQNLEMKVAPAKAAMSWLNEKLGEIKERMTESTSDLQDFKQEKSLIVTGEKQANISLQALSELNAQALAAEARRYQVEVLYQQVKAISNEPGKLMTLPSVINNRLIQDLKAQQMALSKQVAEMSQKYGEKHPQMVRLRSEMDTLQSQIQDEVNLVVSSIRNDYEAALKAEQSLKSALARQKGEAMNYERRSTEYDLMRQDVEGARKIYDAVLQKFQESNLMGNVSMSNVQLLDRAVPPKRPYKPKKALNLLMGLLMGAFAGAGFAFIFEYLDNTYKSPEEVEDHLGLPFLGVVPNWKDFQDENKEDCFIAISNPTSSLAESFRNIRGNILLATGDIRPKVVQVCSALHSEGKSTVSLNLASVMASAGEKVLLIDGDMRRPQLHKAMKTANSNGLSSLLAQQSSLNDTVKSTCVSNLDFIPSGPVSPNPGELIGSRALRDNLDVLKGRYDRIIIDCPPYLGLADSSLLTPLSDGVVLVVRSGKTPKDMVLKASRGLEAVKARILGVVLNDLKTNAVEYYGYNYSHYYNDINPANK